MCRVHQPTDLRQKVPFQFRSLRRNHRQGYTYGRQFILYKLKTIHLDEVSYEVQLTQVLKQLTALSENKDTEGLGVSFIVKNRDDFVSQQSCFAGRTHYVRW